jgi:hypothetical protein
LLQPEAGPGSLALAGRPFQPRRHRLHDARVYLSAQQVVTPVEVSALLAGWPAPIVHPRAPQLPESADEIAPDWRRILVGISVGVGVMAAVWTVLALLFLL